jgi:hypothetical protein
VQFAFGANRGFTFPVAAGDPCLVLFHDRDMDNWFVSGGAAAPNSIRMHSLSDGLVIVGFRSIATPIGNFDEDAVVMRNRGAKIRCYNNEDIRLNAGGGRSAVEMADKIKLLTASGSLNTVFSAIITALTALNGKTGPSAATQITAAQTAMNNLTEP